MKPDTPNIHTAWFHLYEVKEKKGGGGKQICCHKNKKAISSESEGRKTGMKELSGVMEICLDFSGGYRAKLNSETAVNTCVLLFVSCISITTITYKNIKRVRVAWNERDKVYWLKKP